MNRTIHHPTAPESETEEHHSVSDASWDWPSALMIIAAVAVCIWSFWPVGSVEPKAREAVAVGRIAPGLWCVDADTGEPMLGLLPKGWFIWLVIGPESTEERDRLQAELDLAQETWKEMADLDRWKRVVVGFDLAVIRYLERHRPEPALTPYDIGMATRRTSAIWGEAQRVRHVLIEPTGRILMIEPAESERPGTLEKIHQDLRRRLRAWEGEFDDLPRFS